MMQGVLGLLLAHHRRTTSPCLPSITSSKYFFYLVFIFESGNYSIFPELYFFIFFLCTLQKSKFLFDSGVPLSLWLHMVYCLDTHALITVSSQNLTYNVTVSTSLSGSVQLSVSTPQFLASKQPRSSYN